MQNHLAWVTNIFWIWVTFMETHARQQSLHKCSIFFSFSPCKTSFRDLSHIYGGIRTPAEPQHERLNASVFLHTEYHFRNLSHIYGGHTHASRVTAWTFKCLSFSWKKSCVRGEKLTNIFAIWVQVYTYMYIWRYVLHKVLSFYLYDILFGIWVIYICIYVQVYTYFTAFRKCNMYVCLYKPTYTCTHIYTVKKI